MIATGRYELAILLPKQPKKGYYLFFLSILLALIFSFLLFVFVLMSRHAEFWNSVTKLKGLSLLLIPFGVFLFAITMPAAFLANRLKKFKLLSLSKMTGSGSTGILSLIFGYLGFHLSGLVFSKLTGWVVETATLLIPIFKTAKPIFSPFKKNKLCSLAKQYKNFPKYSTPEGLLNTGFKQIPVLALAAFFSPELAGFYTLSATILSKPFGMVSSSFGLVFFQKASEEKDGQVLKKIFKELLQFLFYLAIIPTVVLFLTAPQVFTWIYGASWAISGDYARWMLPFFFITYLKSPFSGMVDLKNVFVKNLIFEIGFIVISTSAFTIGYYFNDDLLALKIFSIGNSTLGLFQLYWFYQLINQKTNW